MGERLKDFWADLLALVPEILLFIVILVVGFFIAKIAKKGTDALLNKLRVNRLFQRNVEKATSRRIGWNVVTVLSKVVFWVIVLFTLYFGFGVFGDNAVTDLLKSIIDFLPKLAVALLIVVIAAAIAGVVRDLVSGALDGLSYGRTLGTVAGCFILGFGLLAALAQVGVAVAVLLPLLYFVLLTIAGIAIVGVGGALITVLRPRLENALNSVQAELENAQEVVANTETDNPDNIVAVPVVEGPPRLSKHQRTRPDML